MDLLSAQLAISDERNKLAMESSTKEESKIKVKAVKSKRKGNNFGRYLGTTKHCNCELLFIKHGST